MVSLKDRIKLLAEKSETTIAFIEKKLGFSKGYMSKWDFLMPSAENLAQVAKFLNTSSEWLLYGEEPKKLEIISELMTGSEWELVENYRLLDNTDKIKELERIKTLAEISQTKNKRSTS